MTVRSCDFVRFLIASILVIFIGIKCYSQDWQCIHASDITYFLDTNSYTYPTKYNTIWPVRIDSVSELNGTHILFSYPRLRVTSENYDPPFFYSQCLDPRGASRIGKFMLEGPEGNFFINNKGDSVRVLTDKHTGDSWMCCRIADTSNLFLSVISESMDTVLGTVDSVKHMTFQACDMNGQPISHPLNNQPFSLSKHFGMLHLYDFWAFPEYDPSSYPCHNLAGWQSETLSIGIHNLDRRKIFSYSPGDEFHTRYKDWWEDHNTQSREIIQLSTILDSTWSPDGSRVTYKIARYTDFWWGWDDLPHEYSRDTLNWTCAFPDTTFSGLDELPEESAFDYDNSGMLLKVGISTQYPGKNSLNSRLVKSIAGTYPVKSFCADTLVGYESYPGSMSSTVVYIEGFGGGYYSYAYDDGHFYYHKSYSLLYFKKGDVTYGTPVNTSGWQDPNDIREYAGLGNLVRIYPCPAGNSLTLELPETGISGFQIEIMDIYGRRIQVFDGTGSRIEMDISSVCSGVYLLKLSRGNHVMVLKKFMHIQ